MQLILQQGRHAPRKIFPDKSLISFSAIITLSRGSPVSRDNTSGASAVATTPTASVGFPVGRIVIVGAPVKNYHVNNKHKMEFINYPTPRRERRAADNGNTAVAAIGVVRTERSRSLSGPGWSPPSPMMAVRSIPHCQPSPLLLSPPW